MLTGERSGSSRGSRGGSVDALATYLLYFFSSVNIESRQSSIEGASNLIVVFL